MLLSNGTLNTTETAMEDIDVDIDIDVERGVPNDHKTIYTTNVVVARINNFEAL
jgi:hypothetical protein